MTADSWRLSLRQWDFLVEALRLDGLPFPLTVISHGRSDEERARLRADVRVELRRAGLIRGPRLDADLEAVLRLLWRPQRWIDSVWLDGPDAESPVRVLAALAGRQGVLAVQRTDRDPGVQLTAIGAGDAAGAVIGALPGAPPGGTSAFTVPSAERAVAQRAAAEPAGIRVRAHRPANPDQQARRDFARITGGEHPRMGQLAINERGPDRVERRSTVLRWCDVEGDGRYSVLAVPGHGGQDIRVAPADPAGLVAQLARLVALAPVR